MKFFDPKEDVIDIKLTQYGKHLLSKGKFTPTYYAFFDDDIIYDVGWVTGSVMYEAQSDIADRIQDDTPRLRAQHCFHGVETEIKKINELVRQKKAKLGDEMLQPMASKHHSLALPLGNSSLNSRNMPAWEAYFLQGSLNGSVQVITGSSPNIKIPQLDCTVTYKARAFDETEEVPMSDADRQRNDDSGGDQDHVGKWGGEVEFEDGSTLQVFRDYLLLELEEKHTEYLEDNFDIEVYEIKEYEGSGSAQPGEGKGPRQELVPLYFARQSTNLGELYLTNAPQGSAQDFETMFPEVDPSYVEYFFEVNVDREIDDSVVCASLPDDQSRSLRLQRHVGWSL